MKEMRCSKGCVPAVEKPLNIQNNVLYAVECLSCGYHILFTKDRRLTLGNKHITEFIMLGDQKPLNLPLKVDPSFMSEARKLRHLYSTKPEDVAKLTPISNRDILYEMLADGDINIDQFNKLITKFGE